MNVPERAKIRMLWEFVSYVEEEFAKITLSMRRLLRGKATILLNLSLTRNISKE
jgi:hypothetical protein